MHKPLESDYLCVMIDAKAVPIPDEKGTLVRAHMFLALGITLQGHKEILAHAIFCCPKYRKTWKAFLLDLKKCGLARVALVVTDEFPGLSKLLAGLFPHTVHQLCTVHLLRNARQYFNRSAVARFLTV